MGLPLSQMPEAYSNKIEIPEDTIATIDKYDFSEDDWFSHGVCILIPIFSLCNFQYFISPNRR